MNNFVSALVAVFQFVLFISITVGAICYLVSRIFSGGKDASNSPGHGKQKPMGKQSSRLKFVRQTEKAVRHD